MKTVKIRDLVGPALDWVVAKALKHEVFISGSVVMNRVWTTASQEGIFSPTTDWSQAGLIIESEGIKWNTYGSVFYAWTPDHKWFDPLYEQFTDSPRTAWRGFAYGQTLLLAVMRCYATSTLGEEVEIPEELV